MQFVRRLQTELHDALADAKMHDAKLHLRLLAALVNASVVVPSSLVAVLRQLLSAAAEAEDQNGKVCLPRIAENVALMATPRHTQDCFMWLVMSTLPWCSMLFDRCSDDVSSIMEQLEGYMAARPKVHCGSIARPDTHRRRTPSIRQVSAYKSPLAVITNDEVCRAASRFAEQLHLIPSLCRAATQWS